MARPDIDIQSEVKALARTTFLRIHLQIENLSWPKKQIKIPLGNSESRPAALVYDYMEKKWFVEVRFRENGELKTLKKEME